MEMIEAYDREGRFITMGERKKLLGEIRQKSIESGQPPYAVPAFNVLLMNSKHELYITQRADSAEDPFLWDKTAGGHVVAGESFINCVIRECQEEIGITPTITDALTFWDVCANVDFNKTAVIKLVNFDIWDETLRLTRNGSYWNKAWRSASYFGLYDGNLKFVDGEVLNVKMVTIKELKEWINDEPEKFTDVLKNLIKKYEGYYLTHCS